MAKSKKGVQVVSSKAKDTETLRGLKAIAKRINTMIEKAATGETRAFDLRLSAACTLAEARATCKEAKINFEKWCEANVNIGYKEAKRLALVGAADSPGAALEDMRAKQAARGRKHREKTKESRTATGPGRVTHAAPSLPPTSPYVAALDTLAALPEADQAKLVKDVAHRVGLSVAAKGEVVSYPATVQTVVIALKKLTPSERRKVIRQLTELVEQDAAAAGVQAAAGEIDLKAAQPASLVRTGKATPKKRGKTTRTVKRGARA